jgi:hypothetical protein
MDRELQDLRDEIIDLTRTMRELGGILSSLVKIQSEISESTKSFAKNTKKIDENTKAQEELNKTYKQQGIIVDQHGKALKSNARAAEEATEAREKENKELVNSYVYRRRERTAFQDLSDELSTTRGAYGRLQEGMLKLAGGSMGAQAAFLLAESAIKGLGKAAISMSKDLYSGQRGAQVSAKALTELADTIGSAAQGIGLAMALIPGLGIAARIAGVAIAALGATAKAAAKFNELAAEQADRLFKSFREVSKVGAATADGMDGVFNVMQTLGMTAAELEDFNKIITTNGTTLARMGATAAQGTKLFAQVAGTLYKSDAGRQLEMLGVSAQEQREAALIYMSIQARSGQLQLKNTQQLATESAKFVKELDLAARLTGQTREDQARAREAALAEERYRSAVVAARLRGDTEEMTRLERAADIAGALKAFGDTRGATGVLQLAASGGAMTTPEAVAAEMTYGITRILNNPSAPLPEALKQMVENAKVQQRGLAETNRMIGTIEGIQTNVVGIDDFVTRMQPLIAEAARQGKTLNEFLETEQGKLMAAGGDTKSMVDAGRTQQGAAMTMDSVVKSFNGAASVNKAASDTFKSAVNTFAGTVGANRVVGGTPGGTPAGQAPTSSRAFASGPAKPTTSDYLSKMMQLESGGRNIPTGLGGGTSSAFGLYQITKTTFDGLVANAPPGSPLKGKTFEDMKADTELQTMAATMLTDDNARKLAARGLSTSDAAKYMSHVLGYPTAARILEANQTSNIGSLVSERARINNPKIFQGIATAGDLRKRFSDITGGGGYRYGGITSGPRSGYTAVLHGTEAIVPLPDGKSIPVKMPDFSASMDTQIGVMSAQLGRLEEIVSVMKDQVSVSNKILQASRN